MTQLWNIFTSLRLTVILLGFSMALVFFGTLDQVQYGVFEVQKRYFESIFVTWQYPEIWPAGKILKNLFLPLAGGYLIGFLLIINLICAHFKYFNPSWKKIGISFIHTGIMLLIVSGFLTSFWQMESQMWIKEGETANFSKAIRENEFVIIDKTDPNFDDVYTIPENTFKKGNLIKIENAPFSVKAEKYFPNADLGLKSQNPTAPASIANQGAALKMGLVAFPKKQTFKDNEINTATAYAHVYANDKDLGIWLVSNLIDDNFPSQKFTHNGHDYEIALRFKRTYLPFSLKLLKFTHERYPGTQIPKNFSSLVDIIDSSKKDNRQTLIYMNHPLRYKGFTFYQSSFGEQETESMFQVVRNPSRLLPYIAVWVVGLGLLIHFLIRLWFYLKKRQYEG